jgi:Zn-dependent metalloprotease
MASHVQGFGPSQDSQPVLLWSSEQKSHGMIPPHLISRAAQYYKNKGDDHIVEDFARQLAHSHSIRHNRATGKDEHKTLLPDGQVVKVYSAKNTEKLRLQLIRDTAKVSTDRTVNEAYDGASATYQLLKEVYKTKSVDGQSYPLNNTVHYDRNYSNAFWNGAEMVFGDGDGKIFDRFTIAIDVTGHEIGHGVTQDQCGTAISKDGKPTGIDYTGEAGGINEGLSDILGIQVKQRAKKQTALSSDWLIGEGLILGSNGKKYALRSMSKPGTGFVNHPRLGTDSQIGNYADYVSASRAGEVDPHDSSGIVNKAFYEASVKLGGNTWDKAGMIFFKTLPSLKTNENFAGIADKTIATASKLFGKDSPEESAIRGGWKTVGVKL